MFKRSQVCSAVVAALGGVLAMSTAPSFGQTQLERVEITGSSIKRVDSETALPVTVIKRVDIERIGAATVEDLLSKISSSNGQGYSTGLALGDAGRPGFAGVSIRALGSNNTLILVNGRRLAVYALDGGSVNINDIPLAAVDRIEILRDGASALYGTDAIAGVINLITKKEFRGLEAALSGSKPTQDGGGGEKSASAPIGMGSLSTDKWSVMLNLGHVEIDSLKAKDRSFASTAYRPDLGVNRLSSNAFPANVATPGLASPAGNFYNNGAGCNPPTSFGTSATDKRCRFDYASVIDIFPKSKRDNLFLKGTVEVGAFELGAEYLLTKNKYKFVISPTPASEATTFNGDPVQLSKNSPFYPTAWIAANFPSLAGKDLNLYWRTTDAGPRTNEVATSQDRLLFTADATFGKWDAGLALMRSTSKATERYTNGYLYEHKLLGTGNLLPDDPGYSAAVQPINIAINPFGANDAAGIAAINDSKVIADTRISKSTRTAVDGKVSTADLFVMPGGSAGLAVGFESRREAFDDNPLPILNSGDIIGGAGSQLPVQASRTVQAVYTEFSLPITKSIEATLSARYDKYSDFGNTFNPKAALRWKVSPSMLLRGSVGTGFRAPTLPDLFQPLQKGNTNGVFDDPLYDAAVGCTTTFDGRYCGAQLTKKSGGNPSVQPEKSSQFSVGMVFDLAKDFSVTMDYFSITQKGLIGITDADTKLQDYIDNFNTTTQTSTSKYAGDVFTKVDNNGHKVVDYILENFANLGDQKTKGIDVSVKYRVPGTSVGNFGVNWDATYLISQRQKDATTGQWTNLVGSYQLFGGTLRFRHRTELLWNVTGWEASAAYNWQSHYDDAAGGRTVGVYETVDLGVAYTGIKNLSLSARVRNVLDKNPPSSNQNSYFSVGFDPANSDPRGRTIVLGVQYKFF